MPMTAEEFDQSITLSPQILQWAQRRMTMTPEEIEELKNFRLAFGFVWNCFLL